MRSLVCSCALLALTGCYTDHQLDPGADAAAPTDARPADAAPLVDALPIDAPLDAHSSCADGDACDDGDPCTIGDRCRADVCSGTALPCESPPGVCFATSGTCVAGECVYTPDDDALCDDGDPCTTADVCTAGVCGGDALWCGAPPPPQCVDGRTVRSFSSAGTCELGTCSYAPFDRPCDDSCIDGGCRCVPQPWSVPPEVVDPGPPHIGEPGPKGIAVDAAGGVHVVYRAQEDHSTWDTQRYAYRPAGGSWRIEEVGRAWGSAVMDVDPRGGVHALYQHPDMPAVLVHAERAPTGGWTLTDLPRPLVMYPWEEPRIGVVDLAIDGSAGLHAVVSDDRARLFYASRPSGGAWTLTEIDRSRGQAGIAIDASRGVHIVYAAVDGSPKQAYLPHGGAWRVSAITEDVSPGDLTIDAAGTMHVFASVRVVDAHPWVGVLRHAWRAAAGGAWTVETVPVGGVDNEHISVALDGRDALHVAYIPHVVPHDHNPLGHARRDPTGVWFTEHIDTESDHPWGPYQLGIAADEDGGVHVVYGELPHPLRYTFHRACP